MTTYNPLLSQYISDLFVEEDEILKQIQENILNKGLPPISILPEEGLFLQVLVRAIRARKIVEIGTLGGYSGVWLARGLPPGGKLVTLEKEPLHATVAQEHFKMASLQDIVEVRVGIALELLEKMTSEGPFDFVFMDADKLEYSAYLDWAIKNLRTGGIIAAHNAFRGGSIIDSSNLDPATDAIRMFNHRMANEPCLTSTIFPAGDGTTIGIKIS